MPPRRCARRARDPHPELLPFRHCGIGACFSCCALKGDQQSRRRATMERASDPKNEIGRCRTPLRTIQECAAPGQDSPATKRGPGERILRAEGYLARNANGSYGAGEHAIVGFRRKNHQRVPFMERFWRSDGQNWVGVAANSPEEGKEGDNGQEIYHDLPLDAIGAGRSDHRPRRWQKCFREGLPPLLWTTAVTSKYAVDG